MASSAIGATLAHAILPTGSLVDFAGTTAPTGWLMCDGREVSRTEYANLFAIVGTSYGAGDNSTTFNLPDFRGRFARYNDNMNTAEGAAGRDSGRAHGSEQGQATAKNGLSNSSSSISGTAATAGGSKTSNTGLTYIVGTTSKTSVVGTVSGGTSYVANQATNNGIITTNIDHSHSVSGTAAAQTITGDAETRPINLACNRIIKY